MDFILGAREELLKAVGRKDHRGRHLCCAPAVPLYAPPTMCHAPTMFFFGRKMEDFERQMCDLSVM